MRRRLREFINILVTRTTQDKIQLAKRTTQCRNLYLPHLYALLNDQIHALQYLEPACSERNAWLLNVQVDSAMALLRSSAPFRSLIRPTRLPPREPLVPWE
jgi:hypothetical protein